VSNPPFEHVVLSTLLASTLLTLLTLLTHPTLLHHSLALSLTVILTLTLTLSLTLTLTLTVSLTLTSLALNAALTVLDVSDNDLRAHGLRALLEGVRAQQAAGHHAYFSPQPQPEP
jgi:hypothetical protein